MRILCGVSLAISSLVFNAACSKVLSERSDEQVWNEFEREYLLSKRAPASTIASKVSVDAEKNLRDKLSEIPVRSLFLKCAGTDSSESCYRSALVLQFDEKFRKAQNEVPELKSLDYKKEQASFMAFRSFSQVADETRRFHQSILSGIDLKAREHAEDLFRSCETEKDSNLAIESFELFHPNTEIPKPVYSCIVRNWSSDETALLDETSDRLGLKIVTAEARAWIKKEQISSVYAHELNEILQKKGAEELARYTANKKEIYRGFNEKATEAETLKLWAPQLREKFAFSPVEQWIIAYRQEIMR